MIPTTQSKPKRSSMKKYISLFWSIIIVCVFDNFLTTTYEDSRIGTVCSAVFVILSILYILYQILKKATVPKKFLLTIVISLAIFISYVINRSNLSATVLVCSMLLFASMFAENYSLEKFYQYFKWIMIVIMTATLILNVLYMLGVDLSFLPLLQNTKGVLYYVGFLGNVNANSDTVLTRFAGIWWEPGVYAAYLIIAILLELYVPQKVNKKYFLLLCLSLIFTFSTTGYICFFLLLISFLLKSDRQSTAMKWLALLLLITAIFLALFIEPIFNMLFNKILHAGESFKDRFYSIGANIKVFFKNPILGLGTIQSTDIIQAYLREHGIVRSLNNLNTPLAYFSVFGLLPGIFYNCQIVQFSRQFFTTKISKFIIYITLLLLLSSTNYTFSLFFTVLFFLRREGFKKNTRIDQRQ